MSNPSSASRCLVRTLHRSQISESISRSASLSSPSISTSCPRTYATHTKAPFNLITSRAPPAPKNPPSAARFEKDALVTLYEWPSMKPSGYKTYSEDQLNLPLRKDLLHRAVVFEGDATRSGTASTKHRSEVHKSGRKLMPQKGTGRARNKDARSPILRGGGVVHGPHPRDFSTELPEKIYDLAYRTALSHRYRMGELFVTTPLTMTTDRTAKFLDNFFEAHAWGQGNKRTLLVSHLPEYSEEKRYLKEQMDKVGIHGELQWLRDVDVKDLLSFGRIIIEESALDSVFGRKMNRKDEFLLSVANRKLPAHVREAKFQQRIEAVNQA